MLRSTFRKLATAASLPNSGMLVLLRILENNFNLSDIVNVRTWWRDRNFLTPVQRLSEFIETVLLPNISSNIVIFIDEIDSILALDFPADDFLALNSIVLQQARQQFRVRSPNLGPLRCSIAHGFVPRAKCQQQYPF